MTDTHARQEAAAQTSPTSEMRQAISGFVAEFKSFSEEMKTRVEKQEERLTMLDTKQTLARPQLAATDYEAPHCQAFEAYVRCGDDDGLRGLELEGKSLSSAVNSDGGYLVDPQTSEAIQSVLRSASSLRAIANVVNVEATSFDVLIDTTDLAAGWATENDPTAETGTPTIDRISIPLHELSALPKASQRLLDDSAFDIEGWLAARIAEKFARAEGAAFISGDGVEKPRGVLAHAQVDNGSWSWGTIGTVPSGTAGSVGNGDAIIDLVYTLGAQYRANGVFVMNSRTVGAVRKLKDGDGRFLWTDGLGAAQPARLLGYPVLICEDMPDIAADATPIAFGDFGAGYTIAERPDVRVLRDPFSAKPHVLFYATKRVGGDVSDFAAIKLLRCAA